MSEKSDRLKEICEHLTKAKEEVDKAHELMDTDEYNEYGFSKFRSELRNYGTYYKRLYAEELLGTFSDGIAQSGVIGKIGKKSD